MKIGIRGRKGFVNGMGGKAVCRCRERLTGIKDKGFKVKKEIEGMVFYVRKKVTGSRFVEGKVLCGK